MWDISDWMVRLTVDANDSMRLTSMFKLTFCHLLCDLSVMEVCGYEEDSNRLIDSIKENNGDGTVTRPRPH